MQGRIRVIFRFTLGVLPALGLAACGNGGAMPAAPLAPIAVSEANAEAVAAAAISVVSGVTSIDALTRADLAMPRSAPPARALSRLANDVVTRTRTYLGAAGDGSDLPRTYACAQSGSYTLEADARSAQFAFRGCSDVTGELMTGRLTLGGIVMTQTHVGGLFSADLTLMRSNDASVRMAGKFDFAFSYVDAGWTGTISSSRFALASGGKVDALLNFSFTDSLTFGKNEYRSVGEYTLAGTSIKGAVTVRTLSPIQSRGSRTFPRAGELLIAGSGGSKLRIKVLGDEGHAGDDVRIEIDADGDGLYEAAMARDWSALPI